MNSNIICRISIISFLIIYGCKKDSTEDTKPVCKISSIDINPGNNTDYYYNENDKLREIRSESAVTFLSYKTDSIIASQIFTSGTQYKRYYKFNGNGLLSSIRLEFNAAGSSWEKREFIYSGSQLQTIVNTPQSGTPVEVQYTWVNGNVQSATEIGKNITYEYYTDKASMPGDAWYITLMNENGGVEYIKNRNLLKSMTQTMSSGTLKFLYEYTFDDQGKIQTMRQSLSSPAITNLYIIQHKCD